jgi:hypothetical protein
MMALLMVSGALTNGLMNNCSAGLQSLGDAISHAADPVRDGTKFADAHM